MKQARPAEFYIEIARAKKAHRRGIINASKQSIKELEELERQLVKAARSKSR